MHMKSRVVEDAERGGEIKVWSKLNGRPCPGANVLVAARYERRLLVFLLIARERERERGRGGRGEGHRRRHAHGYDAAPVSRCPLTSPPKS
jgi:hypothetical protein